MDQVRGKNRKNGVKIEYRVLCGKILVITVTEKNPKTGESKIIVSHGVDINTGKMVILPCEHPRDIGAVFSPEYNEFVLLERFD